MYPHHITGQSTSTMTVDSRSVNSSDDRQPEYSRSEQAVEVISVFLADDHALVREGTRQLLSLEKDMRVIGEAGDGLEALQKIRQLRPDVVLMDVQMPVIDGITLTRQLTQELPDTAVIMLTVHREQQQMLQAMQYGAKGYLLKSASMREVTQAIRQVHAGAVPIEPTLTGALINEYRRLIDGVEDRSGDDRLSLLTEREVQIMRYLAMGMSNKEIADEMAYAEKTIKNYLSTIFQKLHLRDRTQVAIFALRHGLLPDDR